MIVIDQWLLVLVTSYELHSERSCQLSARETDRRGEHEEAMDGYIDLCCKAFVFCKGPAAIAADQVHSTAWGFTFSVLDASMLRKERHNLLTVSAGLHPPFRPSYRMSCAAPPLSRWHFRNSASRLSLS